MLRTACIANFLGTPNDLHHGVTLHEASGSGQRERERERESECEREERERKDSARPSKDLEKVLSPPQCAGQVSDLAVEMRFSKPADLKVALFPFNFSPNCAVYSYSPLGVFEVYTVSKWNASSETTVGLNGGVIFFARSAVQSMAAKKG